MEVLPPNLALPFINSGKIKALAVTTLKRLPALPNVPTVSEIYPKFESSPWFGFFAPTGTPKNIIDKISKDVSAIVRSEEMNKFQYSLGATPLLLGPEGLDKLMRQDYEIAKKQVQALNIVLD
jgi:tripartite-type tricarboxylate transporter receptor subunit TctC